MTRCQVVDGTSYRYIGDADAILAELRAAGFTIAHSTVARRTDADDQDHLWALALLALVTDAVPTWDATLLTDLTSH